MVAKSSNLCVCNCWNFKIKGSNYCGSCTYQTNDLYDQYIIDLLETFDVSLKVQQLFGADAKPEDYSLEYLLQILNLKNLRIENSDGSTDLFEKGEWVHLEI